MPSPTPGPWRVSTQESHGSKVVAPSAQAASVAWCGAGFVSSIQGSYSIGADEAAANARLIAAAPDMLDLLEGWLAMDASKTGEIAQKTQALLAHIRGQSCVA